MEPKSRNPKPPTKPEAKPLVKAVEKPTTNPKPKLTATAATAASAPNRLPRDSTAGRADADARPIERPPPNILELRELEGVPKPDFSAFQQLLTSIRQHDRAHPLGTVISQSMNQFLTLCDKNTLMCILSGMMGRPIQEGVQFDSLSREEQKPVYGLLCASINRLTLPDLISLMHSLIMTNHFNDSYLRVCAALLEKGVQGAFAWQSGLSQLVTLTADIAALAVNGIMAVVSQVPRSDVLITQITAALQAVDRLSPDVLQNITTALTELERYGNEMLTIGILYIIQRLFTVINGSPEAQAILTHAPLPQQSSDQVVNLVKDGGVRVYNSLIDLINVLLSKPSSAAGPRTPPSPNTQAGQFCLSLVTTVLTFTGNNQAYAEEDVRQKALQKLNNTRHLLGVLFPEWASDLQQGNIATAIKNAADLVTLLRGQILVYVEDAQTPPGRVDVTASLEFFPILTVDLTRELIRGQEADDIGGSLFDLGNYSDGGSMAATRASSENSVIRRGEDYLPFIQRALLENPTMFLTPEEHAGLKHRRETDNMAGRMGTAVNDLFEGLFTGVRRGATILCYPLQLVRDPVVPMLEPSRENDDVSVPTLDHPFIPASMIFISRFRAEHRAFIEKYHEETAKHGNDVSDAKIFELLNDVFRNDKKKIHAYIASLKLSIVWGPTHNTVRYVLLPTIGGTTKPFIALEGAIVGDVARIPLQHEMFGDLIPVESGHMIRSTIDHIHETLSSSVGSGIGAVATLFSSGFSKIRTWIMGQPVLGDSSMSDDEQQQQQQQNNVVGAVILGMNPTVQNAFVKADSAAIAEIVHISETQENFNLDEKDEQYNPDDPAALDTAAPAPGTVDAGMVSHGGSRRRRRPATAKRTHRKAYNKKSNKRKSRKQSSRKKISRRRQSRRK
jgi:hypothetical protein